MNFFAKQVLTHRLWKTYSFQRKQVEGAVGDGLGVWDGNAIKLGCDDLCTTINVIKFIELKKKKEKTGCLFGREWGWAAQVQKERMRPCPMSHVPCPMSPGRYELQACWVRSNDHYTFNFQSRAFKGEWAGAELGCHPVEGKGWEFQAAMVLGATRPKRTAQKIPSKIAVLVRMGFSCCNKELPHKNGQTEVCISLMSGSGGRESRAGLAGLLQENPLPWCSIIPGGHRPGRTSTFRAHIPSNRTERERQIKGLVSCSEETS